jgi:DeoR family glycerol-3-phosphate regulon repressor
VFLVADYTKFGRTATVRLGRLSQMDALFTDRKPPQELISILTDANGKLHVAGD